MDPVELGFFETTWMDRADRDRVADLLQNHVREDRKNLHRDAVTVFVDRFDDRGVLEAQIGVRAQPLALVVGVLGGVIELGLAEMMTAAVIDMDAARHAQPVDPERRQKRMQDAGVVRVFGIFEIQLPVVWQYLGTATEDTRRPVQHPLNPADDLRSEITFEIGRVVAERAEDEAGEFGYP